MGQTRIDKGRWVREEDFVAEMFIGGFLGAYRFWVELLKFPEKDMREHGEELIRAMALIAFERRQGVPETPQEFEAYRYCGLIHQQSAKKE